MLFDTIFTLVSIITDNFHFALVGHLIKGFRHPSQATVSRTMHLLISLLGIIAKPYRRDKFEVTLDSVAYLSGNHVHAHTHTHIL